MRLNHWDYRWDAAYFITICTKDRVNFFGKVLQNSMRLSKIGFFAHKYWYELPFHFPFVKLGEFIVMPDHIHGIIIISNSFNAMVSDKNYFQTINPYFEQVEIANNLNIPNPQSLDENSPKPGSLSAIIRSYKSAVTRMARTQQIEFGWQTRFYDHIIRNHTAYNRISNYIKNNPLNWS